MEDAGRRGAPREGRGTRLRELKADELKARRKQERGWRPMRRDVADLGFLKNWLLILLFLLAYSYFTLCAFTVEQSASAVCLHTSPLLWFSFPLRSPQ